MRQSVFQFSVDNSINMVLVFSEAGKIIYANKQSIRQLEYDKPITEVTVYDIFPEIFLKEAELFSLERNENAEPQTLMVYRGNRTCFPIKAVILPYVNRDIDCNCMGLKPDETVYVCTAYDASMHLYLEKRTSQIEQEAELTAKVKTEFVANVTHELRTPINGILGNTQELISLENEDKKLRLLHLVERGCRDMNALINNILDFSKLESGKFMLEKRRFHFRNMIDYIRGNHSNRIIEKGLDFSITVSPEIPEHIVADELRIVQLLNNLISNAYKFTTVGNIHVEIVKTAQTGDKLELFFMVMDSGIGISKADQDKLFQSFTQVDASISRKYGGTGLGLNICKQLVELMGGSIHVQSEPGKGSTFSFSIWADLPEEGQAVETDYSTKSGEIIENIGSHEAVIDKKEIINKLQALTDNQMSDKMWEFGTKENRKELDKKMSKLILSVEMDNWEKAEMFTEAVKQLVEAGPREVKSASLRLKMAVQRGDYDKVTAAYDLLKEALNSTEE